MQAMALADSPRILIAARDEERRAVMRRGLQDAGFRATLEVDHLAGLARHAADGQVDIVLVGLEEAPESDFEETLKAAYSIDRPIAVYVSGSTLSNTRKAMEAGISAYIIDDLRAERIKPILDVATCRFEVQKTLQQKLAGAEQALRDRKIIDKAKGLLMSRKALTEDEAYQLMRRTAMNRERRLADVAASVVETEDLLN